jgi:transcription-repair coupling factor (superfamily II helicase)
VRKEDAAALTHPRDFVPTIAAEDGFRRIADALDRGEAATIDGVRGGLPALIATALVQKSPGPIIVVADQAQKIDDWLDDLVLFGPLQAERTIASFPAIESLEGEQIAYDELFGRRIRLLKALESPMPPRVIATSIQALLQPTPDAATLADRTKSISVGEIIDPEDLVAWLEENRFHAASAVELPNEYSRRGGVLDIFAGDWSEPVRLEFFGDEIESIRRFDVATQRSTGALDGVELTTLFNGEMYSAHLADFLPENARFLLIEPGDIDLHGRQYLGRLDHPENVHTVRSVMDRAMSHPTVLFSELAQTEIGETWTPHVESSVRFECRIDDLCDELDEISEEDRVVLVCQTAAESQRLQEVLEKSKLTREGRLSYATGRLSSGFRLSDHKTLLIGSNQLFNRTDVRRAPRRRIGKAIDGFTELKPGDLVVHLTHGIGRYRGVKLLKKQEQSEEHLELEFAEGTKIFVPASKIGLVQKYVGGSKAKPRLAKVGGTMWTRRKALVESAVMDLASDMIDLQAQREARPGILFPPDSSWQLEFDAAFPYEETEDQLHAIEAIKQDMVRSRPMDRLLCGDVGFGKTEMAMRAAFKAVDAGYQVGILVPTTVLAEQHYRTFSERMAEFPFEIAALSRFASKKEQAEIVKRLAAGTIDIVIGTHRLAQRDVMFKNLGFLVIDEEQRFGVEIKDQLKALRQVVDVLTMTATPIPRTLHMSLLGIRDISNLETPPEDRTAVETRVHRFNDKLIRHAVMRELNRDGQIFFVHNRVRDIDYMLRKLKQIVPEARIEIGHAQMPEDQLEKVMTRFVRHEFDLLLCTTIVESGLDIPNANTMFINDANRFGLSQLHQLRGRVGRYKHQAYCYLLIDPTTKLKPIAAKRLHAIEEFAHLGAGFALSMRDLEIRGAGNILGTQQSGHIALIGYELYCQLLENAVRRLKQLPPKTVIEVDLDLPIDAYIPSNYAGDLRLKVNAYRKISRLASPAEVEELRDDFRDRFGPPPVQVERLFDLSLLRISAHRLGVSAVRIREGMLMLEHTDRERLLRHAKSQGTNIRFIDGQTACCPLPAPKAGRVLSQAEENARILSFATSFLR